MSTSAGDRLNEPEDFARRMDKLVETIMTREDIKRNSFGLTGKKYKNSFDREERANWEPICTLLQGPSDFPVSI